MNLQTTRGLVAATLLMLAAAAMPANASIMKEPSAQHAQPPTFIVAAAPQQDLYAITMAYQAEAFYQAQAPDVMPAQFEGTASMMNISITQLEGPAVTLAASEVPCIGRRGEESPGATACISSMLNKANDQGNVNAATNFVEAYGTRVNIGNKLSPASAAVNNSAKTGFALRL